MAFLQCLSFALLMSFSFGISHTSEYDFPFQDPSLPWDKRVDDLVGRLTLDEIVPQTLAVYGSHTPAIERLGIKPYIWITECIHGQVSTNTTAFPQSIGLAATFSNALLYEMAEAISYEVRAHWNMNRKQGIYTTMNGLSCFSPVINIMRHPLWGRNQETYGECPFLSGTLVSHYVTGLQGNHDRYIRANAGCKHFDVHGGPENIPVKRFSFDAKVSTRDWRMTFLPQFKMCVDAGTYSLMCSYNSINGVPACANKKLLTDIARKEWGFHGYVVSDDNAVRSIMTQHHYRNNSVDTAAASIGAGCNLELGSTVFKSQVDAMKAGKLTETQIRDNLKPLMYTRMRLGEFDPEGLNPYNDIDGSFIQSDKHRALALKAAQQTMTLLKNDGDWLPLKQKVGKVAIVGPMANNPSQQFGDYGSNVLPQYTTTPLDTLKMLGDKYSYASGCNDNKCAKYNATDIKNAVTGSDITIICLGTGPQVEAEGNDRSSLALPGEQLTLLKSAVEYSAGAGVILLLFNAGPLDITWAKSSPAVTAIMECYFPAQSAGQAIYNVLTATGPDSVPAGRLPATWPADMTQVPPMTNYTMEGRTYRYYKGEPLYPFGYGLSYSIFNYEDLKYTKSIKAGESIQLEVMVENFGPYDADEVTQVYFSWGDSTTLAPKLQLVGFTRTHLRHMERRNLKFTITPEQIQVWVDDNKGFQIIKGQMKLYVGGQQPSQTTRAQSDVLIGYVMVN